MNKKITTLFLVCDENKFLVIVTQPIRGAAATVLYILTFKTAIYLGKTLTFSLTITK